MTTTGRAERRRRRYVHHSSLESGDAHAGRPLPSAAEGCPTGWNKPARIREPPGSAWQLSDSTDRLASTPFEGGPVAGLRDEGRTDKDERTARIWYEFARPWDLPGRATMTTKVDVAPRVTQSQRPHRTGRPHLQPPPTTQR